MEAYINNLIKQTVELINKTKSHGDYFNLLIIAGVGASEVLTHTPILKELLDPNGSHGQGNLFLKSFVKSLKLNFCCDDNVFVKREFRNSYGQIDLLIENKNNAIVVENKIHAEDQSKQLNRYYDYCIKQNKKPILLYLTLRGDEPSSSSLGSIKKIDDEYVIVLNNKNIIVNLQCISYEDDIAKWLEELLSNEQLSQNIKAAIKQYLNLLSMLTSKLITAKKELNTMLENVNSNELLAIKQLSQVFESSEYRGKLLFKLFEYIQEKFLATNNFILSDKYEDIIFTEKKCIAWFNTSSKKNQAVKRNIIGCVLKSKINSKITFLFIVATNHIHYGVVVESEDLVGLDQIKLKFPTWEIRSKWKKINKDWVSQDIGSLRAFSGSALKLLGANNVYLDDFINERINELNALEQI